MAAEYLPPSLQESILAALVYDERAGAAIAAQVSTNHFDDTYRDIAVRVLDYRRRYGRGPGRSHLDDLFGKALAGGRTPRLRRLLFDLAALADGLNGDYVISRTQEFIREQTLKGALQEAAARYEQGGDNVATDIETILSRSLRQRTESLDAGTFLNDPSRAFKFLDAQADGIKLGIEALDNTGFRLAPREQLLYIAPKASGKTWLCVHVGAQGLLQTQKVLHLSLEWPEEKVAGRYYQRLFAAGMKSDEFMQALLTVDDNGSLTGFRMRRIAPKWSLTAQGSRKELARRVKLWGRRLGRVVIKSFPSGSLTMSQLEGYLDYLEAQHKFIPTVLIVDYPDLMAQDAKNLRVTIGRTFVDLRGLAHKRNLALFTPTQGNRGALSARQVRASAASEDITKVFTADTVMTYSRTEAEKERGLARLFLEHTRNMADGLEFVITQSYNTGQYVLSSMQATPAYFDQVEVVGGARATEGPSEDSGDW